MDERGPKVIVMLREFHLSDRELLMAADGELSRRETERVESHLEACWACRTRKQELEGAIGEFIHFHRESFDDLIPPANGPLALLKARLRQLTESGRRPGWRWLRSIGPWLNWVGAAAALLLVVSATIVFHAIPLRYSPPSVAVMVPNPRYTPGATVLIGQREVCRGENVKDKAVPAALQRRVFAEYGIKSVAPGAYEIDYLITPALGGADDIHNLWPQTSESAVWNAEVKDVLEDRLHDLVCDGQLDLATAQREIAENWIGAYKKYFHTDRPTMVSH